MTDDAIIQMLREYHEGLFPKVCPNCGRRFATLREYVLATQPLWPSVAYDVEMGDYKPLHPIGTLAMGNCHCGTTLALSTKGLPLSQTHQILEWLRTETVRRGLDPTELLDYVRSEIRRQVLIESTQRVTSGLMESCMPNVRQHAIKPQLVRMPYMKTFLPVETVETPDNFRGNRRPREVSPTRHGSPLSTRPAPHSASGRGIPAPLPGPNRGLHQPTTCDSIFFEMESQTP